MLEGFTQALLDAVPDALMITDGEDSHLLVVNQICLQIFQTTAQETIDRSVIEFLVPEEHERWRRHSMQLDSAPSAIADTFTFIAGRDPIRCEVRSRVASEAPRRLIHSLRALETKLANEDSPLEHTRDGERRSRALLKAVPDPIFRMATNGQILDYKYDGAGDLLIVPRDQIVGSNIFDLPLDDSDKARIRQVMAQTIATGELQSTDYALTLGGKRRMFEARFVAEESDRVLAIVRETTNQRHSEEALARIEKLEALGILAAGIAHDFNNLVAGAFGHVEMAREYIIEDKVTSAVDCLAEAAGAFNRARELTRQLLTFSKGGAPNKVRGQIGPTVRRAVESVLSCSNIVCRFTEDASNTELPFDEAQLTQVFESLATNARQAMPLGGTLDVSISIVTINVGGPLPLSVGTYTKISFRDSGEGIPLENMPKLFDPFFTTKKNGTGLGLASSFSIIKRHGGHLDIDSELGNGTTCSVYIPHDSDNLAEPRTFISSRPMRQGRVLVMDDEDAVRRVTCALLMRLGYEVISAADGAEAIEIYRRSLSSGNRFAFVILDLTVPGGLGGRETLATLREMDPTVAAIATTGYSNDSLLSNPEAYGFRAGLAKPYSRQEFIGLIGRVTG